MKRANDVISKSAYDFNIRHCYRAFRKQIYRREKDNITTKCTVIAAIFEDFVSRVIPVAVVKINKLAESGSPRLKENEVFFADVRQ